MSKAIYGVCIGGPMDGVELDAPDNAKARNQSYIKLQNEVGEQFVYVRDTTEHPDGRVRFHWIPEREMERELKDFSNAHISHGMERSSDAPKAEGRIKWNPNASRYELYFDGELVETKTQEQITTPEDVRAWASEWGQRA